MTAPVQPAPLLLRQPKEPPTFRGSPQEDPESWIERFDRVASFIDWTDDDKLWHVYFALEDAAGTWFENQELSLTTWDVFRARFLTTFASVVLKEKAAALLETRMQMPNENVALFTEGMTKLFRHADSNMSEKKKVRLLMRGVKHELFVGLIRNPAMTVAEFISVESTIEKTLEMRTRQYNCSFSYTSYDGNQALGTTDLRETIRAIVQEELRKLLPSAQPHVESIADVVRQEILQSLGVS